MASEERWRWLPWVAREMLERRRSRVEHEWLIKSQRFSRGVVCKGALQTEHERLLSLATIVVGPVYDTAPS